MARTRVARVKRLSVTQTGKLPGVRRQPCATKDAPLATNLIRSKMTQRAAPIVTKKRRPKFAPPARGNTSHATSATRVTAWHPRRASAAPATRQSTLCRRPRHPDTRIATLATYPTRPRDRARGAFATSVTAPSSIFRRTKGLAPIVTQLMALP